MLSALTRMAQTNPQQIKDSMKDNLDGTVTVRFFDKNNNNEPVYITVNKTVNKIAGVNAYASSSLWVQMMEKAYTKFVNTVAAKYEQNPEKRANLENGFNGINRSTSAEFLNAFTKDKYEDVQMGFGAGPDQLVDLYRINPDGSLPDHPKEYMNFEKEMYNFLDKNVTKGKEIITVGCQTGNEVRKQYALDHGIRIGHAYSVVKTFEQEVDGKMKKFVQLRDPYATFRSKYDEHGNLVNDSELASATYNAGTDNMGTFNLELTDFQKIFNSFPGISEKANKEFTEMRGKWRDYDKFPLTPEEKAAIEAGNEPKTPEEQTIKFIEDEQAKARANDEWSDLEGNTFKTNENPKPHPEHVEVIDDGAEVSEEKIDDDTEYKKDTEDKFYENTEPSDSKNEKKDDFFDDFEDVEHPNELPEVEGQSELFNTLRKADEFNKMKAYFRDLAKDLANTDEWFVWSNTDKFNKMRDALNDVAKQMNKMDVPVMNPLRLSQICDKIQDLAEKSDSYLQSKIKSVNEKQKAGKDPSTRALHRLTDALSIKKVCNLEMPIKIDQNKQFKENISLVVNDINERCERLGSGQPIIHDNKTVDDMLKVAERMNNYIERHPEIKKDNIVKAEAVNKLGQNVADIKDNKIQDVQKTGPEKNGLDNNDFLKDFEML